MMNFINTQIVKAQAALHVAQESLADRLSARSEGQAMVEYGLVLVLVSVVAVVGLTAIGNQLVSLDPTSHAFVTGSKTEAIFNKIADGLAGKALS